MLKYLMHHNDFLRDQSGRVEQYWTDENSKQMFQTLQQKHKNPQLVQIVRV